MKIAIAQLNPTVGDLTGNAQQILEVAQQAIEAECRLLVTTELSLVGYPPRDLLIRPSFIQAITQQLEQLAKDLPPQLAVLVGTVEPNPNYVNQGGKPLFNSAALLENGTIKRYFQKRLLPTYDVFDEHRYFEPASTSKSFTLFEKYDDHTSDFIQVGVAICEDLWNDDNFWGKRSYAGNPWEDLAKLNVDLIVNLSASPYQVGKGKLRQSMITHSVKRFKTPIIYVNQVGGNDDLLFDGFSFVFNRDGDKILSLKGFEADFARVEFNSESRDFKGIYSTDSVELTPDEEIYRALVLGVKDYARKCGFSKALLGLSGGIDSSLVAAIATEALGKENILGVLMPSPYSSDHSIHDALKLAESLGIQTETLPIGDLMKTFDQTLEDIFQGTSFGLAEENLQSRIRGTLLMAISNKFGHLLLSTGNKSELAVGYCTLYGDMNGGLSVIADVPKTRVYSICRWLNQHLGREIIPEKVLTKAPSAELKPEQTDQDSLPPYEILDDILYRMIEQNESFQEILEAGHEKAVVEQVIKLVMRAEFKRRQAPPGLKISDRAFGTGWRMPIAKKFIIHD